MRRPATRLQRTIKDYLDRTSESAVAIEQRGGIPKGSLAHTLRGAAPRVDRLAQLLTGVDAATAASWLRAYLLDNVPEEYASHVSIDVRPLGQVTISPSHGVSQLEAALSWITQRSASDDELAEWLISTVALLRGLHSAATMALDHADAAIEIASEALHRPELNEQPADYTTIKK